MVNGWKCRSTPDQREKNKRHTHTHTHTHTHRFFPYSLLVTGIVARVTRWVPRVVQPTVQERLNRPEYPSSCCLMLSFLCSAL